MKELEDAITQIIGNIAELCADQGEPGVDFTGIDVPRKTILRIYGRIYATMVNPVELPDGRKAAWRRVIVEEKK